MKKKATIITFHSVFNYGAVFQTYGLQETLKKYFETVEVLDYKPRSIYRPYELIRTDSKRALLYSFKSLYTRYTRKKRFESFIDANINKTSICGQNQREFEEYESPFYFLGSDQIWNPDITKGFDSVFFGKVGKDKNAKIISYAASLGKGVLTVDEASVLSKLVSNVGRISVREDEAKTILESAGFKNIEVVVDPTILAGRELFDKFTFPITKKKYALFFSLESKPENVAYAYEIAKRLNLELIEITIAMKSPKNPKRRIIFNASPCEFLSYIKNAEYVITDSFHGTVFSVLFHRPFSSIIHKTRGGRVQTLLNLSGLSDRLLISPLDIENLDNDIDWNDVDDRLANARKMSLDFIEKSIAE